MTIRKMRSAALYGGGHLRAISEDVLTEASYSRAMRTDIVLAMKLLEHAPDMFRLVQVLDAYINAGCVDLDGYKPLCSRIINSIEGGTK